MFVQIKQNATWLALSLAALLLLAAQCSASASTEAPATAPVDEAAPVVSEQQPIATATAVESDVEKEASMAVTEEADVEKETTVAVTGEPDVEKETTVAAPAAVSEVSELKSDFEIIVYQGEDVLGGESVKLSEVLAQGKPVVLNMWAGLCPLCHAQMPKLQEAYDEYGDRVLVVGIDVGSFVRLGSREDGLALLDRLEITYPAGTTPEATIMRDYNVLGTPATYFLKPNGEIIQQRTGILSEAQLNEYIEELLEASASS